MAVAKVLFILPGTVTHLSHVKIDGTGWVCPAMESFNETPTARTEVASQETGEATFLSKWRRESLERETGNTLGASSRGRLDQARRFALQNFDKWNDVTGFVKPHTSYYYELCSLIEDGVEFGFGVAYDQSWKTIVRRIRK